MSNRNFHPQFIFYSISLITVFVTVNSQCPAGIQLPCSCATTLYEPVSIVCDNAGSLATVLSSIGTINVVIDSLVISNTPITQLPAFAFQGLAVKRLAFRTNDLQGIDQRAFDGQIADSLTELEIRNNKIGEIPQSGIPNLRQLLFCP